MEVRPTYIREYKVLHMTKNGPAEYIKKVTLPVPGTGLRCGRPVNIIPDETIARVKQLRADRYTFKKISEMTGLSLNALNKITRA
jgi:hypothetical protein